MSEQPKVLFVLHQIGSGADGGTRSLLEIAAAAEGLPMTIVTNREGPIAERAREVAPTEIWPMVESTYGADRPNLRWRVSQLRERARNNWRCYGAFRRGQFNILHANEQRAFWNSAIGAKLAGGKVIFNVRDTHAASIRSKRRWKWALRLCDRFLVLSKEMVALWKADLAPEAETPKQAAKFAYLYSIVNRERFRPASPEQRANGRRRLGIPRTRLALLYVGRFDGKKAQLALIERALPLLQQAEPDIVTYFVGDFEPESDPYAAACRDAVRRLALEDQVRFAGYSPDTNEWYQAADLTLLASTREGLPRCMIESLACGTPFVTFAVASAREVLEDHRCGIVVEQGDHSALAAEILRITRNPERMEEYRKRGLEVVATLFDRQRNASAYRQFVQELASA